MKSFISVNSEEKKKQITNLMISNGKDERVPFNKNAINMAVNKRCEIAQKEIDAYLNVYDKMKKY